MHFNLSSLPLPSIPILKEFDVWTTTGIVVGGAFGVLAMKRRNSWSSNHSDDVCDSNYLFKRFMTLQDITMGSIIGAVCGAGLVQMPWVVPVVAVDELYHCLTCPKENLMCLKESSDEVEPEDDL